MAYIDELAKQRAFGPEFVRALRFWTEPLLQTLSDDLKRSQRTWFVAMTGAPGTGKTLQAHYLADELSARGFKVASLSVPDFSLSRHAREFLAKRFHPLFIHRGLVGTHDTKGLAQVLEALGRDDFDEPVHIPTFDARFDVRSSFSRWSVVSEKPDIVLVRGWCLGAVAQEARELAMPMNEVEAEEDPDGLFRRAVNRRISADYQPLYHFFDRWVVRQAPGFDEVCDWLLQDERGKRSLDSADMGHRTEAEFKRYLLLLERTVSDMMRTLPGRAHYLFTLNDQRAVASYTTSGGI